MPTTQIGSVSMRYGSAANINQYQNNLYDKELVLEVNTIEKEANSGEYEYTYKLYQIVAENGVNTKLEIPLSSNLIDYLNKNGAFIKGTDSNYSEGLFTTKTEVKQENESFVVKNYFPIDQDTLEGDPYNNGSDFILTLQTISPSGSKEDKVIQCCDFYVTVDKYGRVKTIEAKPNSSIKDLDDAVKTSAQRSRFSQLELIKNLKIGPTSKSDVDYANTYCFHINNNNTINEAETLSINFYKLTDSLDKNYYLNENGYLYFDTQAASEPITSFLKIEACKYDENEVLSKTYTVVIVPDGLFQYKCTETGLALIKLDSKDTLDIDSLYYSKTNLSKIKSDGKIWNVKNNGHSYPSPVSSSEKIFIGSNKYEFLEGETISKADIENTSVFTRLDVRPGIYNMQVDYNIKIDLKKNNSIVQTKICTGTLRKGFWLSKDLNSFDMFGETNDFFSSDNFEATFPVHCMGTSIVKDVIEEGSHIPTMKNYFFVDIFCDIDWLKEIDTDFDSIDVVFGGTIGMLSEMIF